MAESLPNSAGPAADLLSGSSAALAKELEFIARTRVEGYLKSSNPSRLKGQSTDFMQHRQYMPGDDLRHLDWRVLARTDRLVTRQFEEYTNLDVIVVLDVSASMAYGRPLTKMRFASHCAALLAYVLVTQRDRFALALAASGLSDWLPPGSGRKHFGNLCRRLAAAETKGETDLAQALEQLLKQTRRRSVFVVFSDCYQDPDALTRAIGMLRLRGHDAILYQVYDPTEADLDFAGFTLFRDLESDAVDAADPLEIRAAYREVFVAHRSQLETGSRRHRVEFHSLAVTPDWDSALADLLRRRSRAR